MTATGAWGGHHRLGQGEGASVPADRRAAAEGSGPVAAAPPRSWLAGAPDGTLDGLLSLRPELRDGYHAFADQLWTRGLVEPVLLELARVRICVLLGDPVGAAERTPEAMAAGGAALAGRLDRVAGWCDDPACTPVERAALGYAEQFVIDPHGIGEDQAAELLDHLGAEAFLAFNVAVGLFDGFTRFRLTLREAPVPPGRSSPPTPTTPGGP